MDYNNYHKYNQRKNLLLSNLDYLLNYEYVIKYFSIEMNEEFDFFQFTDISDQIHVETNKQVEHIKALFTENNVSLSIKECFLSELISRVNISISNLNQLIQPTNHLYDANFHYSFTTKGERDLHNLILENGKELQNYFTHVFDLNTTVNESNKKADSNSIHSENEIISINESSKYYTTFEKVLFLRLLKKFEILNLNNVKIESEKKILSLLFGNPTHSFTDCYSGKTNDTTINNLIDEVFKKPIENRKNLQAYNKLKPLLQELKNHNLNQHIDRMINHLTKKLGT